MKIAWGILIPSSVDLHYDPVLTFECLFSILQPCVHAIRGKSALELLVFWSKMGGQRGRKCYGWLKMPSAIPIPGFIIHVCEPILTFECFYSSLQPCTCVIWARVSIKLSVFGQIWGSAWH